jgi:hypothetical protein
MFDKYLVTMKQTYLDKETLKLKTFFYDVTIVKDTIDYSYRIMNFNSFTIWKTKSFKTFKEAKDYLDNHPNRCRESDI